MDLNQLKTELIADEGLRLKPYRCPAGKLTIGVGRNLDDLGISSQEAIAMLDNDIERVCNELDAKLPWWRTLDPVRQRVLVNMGFNLGVPTLRTFKNTLSLIEAGKYDDAAAAMFASRWAGQVGDRAQRLALLMRKGDGK